MSTHRPLSSSFLGLPYRMLNRSHQGTTSGPMGNFVISRYDWYPRVCDMMLVFGCKVRRRRFTKISVGTERKAQH